jgi:hypothetical protein
MAVPSELQENNTREIEFSQLPIPNSRNPFFKSAYFVARFPGAANAMIPLINFLHRDGVNIYLESHETAKAIFQDKIPDAIPIRQIPDVDWLVISGDNPVDIELEAIKRIYNTSKPPKLLILEDSTRGVENMIAAVLEMGIKPDLILTITESSASSLKKNFPELKENVPIIENGHPNYERLVNSDIEEIRAAIRKKLDIPEDGVLISYIGTRNDSENGSYTPDNDPNSIAMEETLIQSIALAKENPKKDFHFAYIPHPREFIPFYSNHPVLQEFRELIPPNLKILNQREEGFNQKGLSTAEIGLGSDIVTVTTSNAAEEMIAALSTAVNTDKVPIPIHILLPNTVPIVTDNWLTRSGFVPVAKDTANLSKAIRKSLSGHQLSPATLEEIKYEFLAFGGAARRAWECMCLISSGENLC